MEIKSKLQQITGFSQDVGLYPCAKDMPVLQKISDKVSVGPIRLYLHPGPEISSRPIVRDDHTKRPADYENNSSRPMDDHVCLDNMSQALSHIQ